MNNEISKKCWLSMPVDQNDLHQIVTQLLPNEKVKNMSRRGGNSSLTIEVNREWIIKLPKSLKQARMIETEIEVAKVLAHADLPVPVSQPVGCPFVLEKKDKTISGVACVMPRLDGYTPLSFKGKLMQQCAEFLAALHAVPVRADGLIKSDWNEGVHNILKDAVKKGVKDPSFKEHLQATVFTPFYQEYTQRVHPVLCHGDFHSDNVLIDLNGNLSAVLDFGYAKVATRCEELIDLMDGSVEQFLLNKSYKDKSGGYSLDDAESWREGRRIISCMKKAYHKELALWKEQTHNERTRA